MDFTLLSDQELIEYITARGVAPGTNLVKQASDIFNTRGFVQGRITPVDDLYLALQFRKVNPKVQIDSSIPNQAESIARALNLDPRSPNYSNRINRIMRIIAEARTRELARGVKLGGPVGAVGLRDYFRPRDWYTKLGHTTSFLELKCLTFNVCYQCMTGVPGGTAKPKCLDGCRDTINRYINQEKNCDFVALQEATNFEQLDVATRMIPVVYKPGNETIATFYKRGVSLAFGVSIIKTYLQDTGRPMIILFFPGLTVINLHAGHGTGLFTKKYDFFKLDSHLWDAINNPTTKKPGTLFTVGDEEVDSITPEQVSEVIQRLSNDFILLMGDTNTPFKGVAEMTIFANAGVPGDYWTNDNTRTLVGFHDLSTCCDPYAQTTRENAKAGAYDQILVSKPGLVVDHQIPFELKNASDHLPVKCRVLLPL